MHEHLQVVFEREHSFPSLCWKQTRRKWQNLLDYVMWDLLMNLIMQGNLG
jgi:hypothetical protein